VASLTAFRVEPAGRSGNAKPGTRAHVRGRLRIGVIQVLVLTLFLTLFGRLWFLQVFSGDDYQAKAADQSIRDIVVDPARGLIVDDEGRPLVANRTSWTVTVDRTMLSRMSERLQGRLLHRIAGSVGKPYAEVRARTLLCGEPGSKTGLCWNGSPYQPVPVANDIPQQIALTIMEQNEDFPAVLVQAQKVRSYPSPYGINAAHLLGYLSPITSQELHQAQRRHDESVHGASVVGRAGLEKEYDKYLRGYPGYRQVTVDSMGRVLGDSGRIRGHVGDTVVTSIDARVQAVVEQQLAKTIKTARATYDPVTHKNYVADQGAAVVLDAKTGQVIAMASQPTYNPSVWVNGISSQELSRLYSPKMGTPLLSRAFQGQLAPGSTWKPIMTAGAFENGYGPSSRLDCSSGVMVGNRLFHNYESASYGYIDFAKALQISCDSFFYRVGLGFWQKYGSDENDVNAKDPLVEIAKAFGFGKPTGIDLPGETTGRIADRHWKLAYYKQMKDYYCKVGKKPGYDFLHRFAREFCVDGYAYRAGDAVNFAIGQGDTMVSPLQLARAYAAIDNGGTLFHPQVAKAIVSPQGNVIKTFKPQVQSKLPVSQATLNYIDNALKGTPVSGTLAWRFGGFPLGQVPIRGKTGSAEVYGKQSTSWVASYTPDYVVVMMVSQAGTGSGTSGPAVRKIYEALYGVHGMSVRPRTSLIPGVTPPQRLPVFAYDGSILPPARHESGGQ
jgi:penicillin-binding protein 2